MSRIEQNGEYLKECMADALLMLMDQKPIEKITVREIVTKAGVGRTTWFRHFSSKNKAIIYKLSLLWKQWAEENNLQKRNAFSLDNTYAFFSFILRIRDIIDVIYKNNKMDVLFDTLYNVIERGVNPGTLACYEHSFYVYGLFGLANEWKRRGYKESPEEIAKLLPEIVQTK